ncbi:EAL domain-containing protein [Marinobacter shengliensis]|uniref:EAL domain-containing protein n=1 Tax=Marinobacter shengliensis TaxID=1389223 RepID=UPI0025743D51|nr:EAL domain-containing protein [Marinobacter shengliensis]
MKTASEAGKITATCLAVIFMRHLEGTPRSQTLMLPPSVEDYVPEDHPVRVIDAFVDSLNLSEMGFRKAQTAHTGRRPYHPGRSAYSHEGYGDKDSAVCKRVITLARKLNRTVVAEGVETEEQYLYLARNGCPSFRRYFFARPMPSEDLVKWVQQRMEGA